MAPSAGFFSSPGIRPFLSKRTRQSEAFAVILAQCGPRDGSSVFEPRALFSGATMSKKKKNGLGQRRVGDQRRRARTEKAGDLDFNFPIREASCQLKSYR